MKQPPPIIDIPETDLDRERIILSVTATIMGDMLLHLPHQAKHFNKQFFNKGGEFEGARFIQFLVMNSLEEIRKKMLEAMAEASAEKAN